MKCALNQRHTYDKMQHTNVDKKNIYLGERSNFSNGKNAYSNGCLDRPRRSQEKKEIKVLGCSLQFYQLRMRKLPALQVQGCPVV